MNDPYVSERFAVAVCDLITCPGTIVDRLGSVLIGSLLSVRPADLPTELQDVWADVLQQVVRDADTTPATLNLFSTDEAVGIAKIIARISYEISFLHGAGGPASTTKVL